MWWSVNVANYWFRTAVLKENMSTVYNCANLDVFNVSLFVLYLSKISNYEETTLAISNFTFYCILFSNPNYRC